MTDYIDNSNDNIKDHLQNSYLCTRRSPTPRRPRDALQELHEGRAFEAHRDPVGLNVYVPGLQHVGGVVWYLRQHRGQRFASTATVAPMSEAFVARITAFIAEEGLDLVHFRKGQRKDDLTQQYLARFQGREGVLYVGRAQEKARVMRTERRRSAKTGGTYPWIVDSTAMVNHYYFYCLDENFGP